MQCQECFSNRTTQEVVELTLSDSSMVKITICYCQECDWMTIYGKGWKLEGRKQLTSEKGEYANGNNED